MQPLAAPIGGTYCRRSGSARLAALRDRASSNSAVSESIVDALAVPGNAVVTGIATELQSDQERLLPPAVSGAETPTNDGSRRASIVARGGQDCLHHGRQLGDR